MSLFRTPFLACLVLCVLSVQGQKKKVHVEGVSVSTNKTPIQAINDALLDAKQKALKNAGITEYMSISKFSYTKTQDNYNQKYFDELSLIETNASIIVDSVYSEKRGFDEFGNMIVSVEIDATVIKYKSKRDPSFFFEVRGLKDVYYDNEFIAFSFIPSQNGFLTVFVVNETESNILYPFTDMEHQYLSDAKDQLFENRVLIQFPIHKAYQPGYTIELNNKSQNELCQFIFVYTKKNIRWVSSTINQRSIWHWLSKIHLDQRTIEIRDILLKRHDIK